MGNLGRKNYQEQRKVRALALLRMFKKRIELGFFDVEMADWWVAGSPDKVILRIDCHANDLEKIDTLSK